MHLCLFDDAYDKVDKRLSVCWEFSTTHTYTAANSYHHKTTMDSTAKFTARCGIFSVPPTRLYHSFVRVLSREEHVIVWYSRIKYTKPYPVKEFKILSHSHFPIQPVIRAIVGTDSNIDREKRPNKPLQIFIIAIDLVRLFYFSLVFFLLVCMLQFGCSQIFNLFAKADKILKDDLGLCYFLWFHWFRVVFRNCKSKIGLVIRKISNFWTVWPIFCSAPLSFPFFPHCLNHTYIA